MRKVQGTIERQQFKIYIYICIYICDLGTGRLKLCLDKNIAPSLSNVVKLDFHTLKNWLFNLCIMK